MQELSPSQIDSVSGGYTPFGAVVVFAIGYIAGKVIDGYLKTFQDSVSGTNDIDWNSSQWKAVAGGGLGA